MRTNHKPKIRGTDLGIWRRIQFRHKMLEPEGLVPLRQRSTEHLGAGPESCASRFRRWGCGLACPPNDGRLRVADREDCQCNEYHTTRTQTGRPSSNMRLSTLTAILTSHTRRASSRERLSLIHISEPTRL